MKLSTRFRYGTRLMVNLALSYKKGPLILRMVAKEEMVSKKYLEQIILRLMSANLIKSIRGPKGGYVLTRAPENIQVLDIYNAIEGPLELLSCLKYPKHCILAETCAARVYWQEVQSSLAKTFAKKSLKSLAKIKLSKITRSKK